MHKTRRLNRILARDGRALIVAMDHGAIQGPKGLERPGEVIRKISDGGADAVLTTYGIVRTFGKELAPLGVIMRTDGGASTIGPDISESAPLYSVEDALRLGADGRDEAGRLRQRAGVSDPGQSHVGRAPGFRVRGRPDQDAAL
jgi:DhnA family fructose-bisphosphate aldolase class Ia